MVVEMKEYASAEQIEDTLDNEISKAKSVLGGLLRSLDEIRTAAERSKKIRETLFKLAGKKKDEEKLMGEISVGGLDIVLDANPFHELTAIEQAVRSQQDRLLNLQKSREAMKWMDQLGDTDGITYLVLQNDGIPEKILLKIS